MKFKLIRALKVWYFFALVLVAAGGLTAPDGASAAWGYGMLARAAIYAGVVAAFTLFLHPHAKL